MKILQIVDIAYEMGGAEKSVKQITDELRKRGHEVRVLSTDKLLAGYSSFADELVPVIAGPAPLRLLKHFWYPAAYFQLKGLIDDFRPAVVHLHTVSEFSPSLFWALGRTPAVMTIHGPEEFTNGLLPWLLPARDYRGGSYQRPDLRWTGHLRLTYYRRVQRPAYNLKLGRVKKVIAPSKFMYRRLAADFPETKLKQVYNGIFLPAPVPLPTRHQVVLYVGRLEAVKGVDHLLRAFQQLPSKLTGVELRIIGTGSQQAQLQALAKKLGIARRVTFTGWVEPAKIHREFTMSTVLVVPSVWPENLPTVAIEALAVGRPIVGTDTGGVSELVRDRRNGFIVPPGDDTALAEAITTLLTNPKRLARSAEASRRQAKQFAMDSFIDQLLAIYKDVTV